MIVGLALLAGCVGQPDPEAVDRTLQATNDALASALVVAELLDHVGEEVPRHEGCGTCPCVERIGTAEVYTLLEDYGVDGCRPDSGLLPAELKGHVWLDVGGGTVSTIQAEAASVADQVFQPEFDADWTVDGDAWTADAGCDITVGVHEASLGIDLQTDGDGVVLDGTVETAAGRVELVGVRIPRHAGEACVVPVSGSAVVRAPGRLEVRFTGGEVEVTHGRSTVAADLCAQDRSFLAD